MKRTELLEQNGGECMSEKSKKETKNKIRTFGSGVKTMVDLRLKEMEQRERLESRKLDLEEKKWEYEKTKEGKNIQQVKDLVKTIAEGPVGDAIQSLGGVAAERIREDKSSLVKVQCPECKGFFNVNPALFTVTCVHCGVELERSDELKPKRPSAMDEIARDVEKFSTYRKMFGGTDSATANECEHIHGTIEAKCPNCLRLFPIILGQPKVICPYCRKVYHAVS